jgi:hypothetical protein
MYVGLRVKYALFLSDFNETRILSIDFQKAHKYPILCKSVHWEPICSMQTGRRTDMTKPIVAFRNFANASNWKWSKAISTVAIYTDCEASDKITYRCWFLENLIPFTIYRFIFNLTPCEYQTSRFSDLWRKFLLWKMFEQRHLILGRWTKEVSW